MSDPHVKWPNLLVNTGRKLKTKNPEIEKKKRVKEREH